MTIKYRYWEYSFRECDVKGMTREELEDLAAKTGKMQYGYGFSSQASGTGWR